MMENKSKKNNVLILIALAGVLIVVCAYFLVYKKFNDMADQVERENASLRAEVSRLQGLDAKKGEYIAETERMDAYILEFESHYPPGILPEDSIMMVKKMEERNRTYVANLSFSNPAEVTYEGAASQTTTSGGSSQSPIVADDLPTYAPTKLYEIPLSLSLECTYSDFKGLIDYIYAQSERMSVRGVNISYNAETNGLSGNMTLSTYCLTGTQKPYTPPDIPKMGMGIDTIFGNID